MTSNTETKSLLSVRDQYGMEAVDAGEQPVDVVMLWTVLALTALGVVMVYSSSAVFADELRQDSSFFLKRQLLSLGLGVAAMLFVSQLRMDILRKLSAPIFLAAVVLAVMVLIPGVGMTERGSTRCLPVGPLQMQPAELVKLGLIIYLAAVLARKRESVREFKTGFLGPVMIGTVPIILILAQPDLGTTFLLGAILFLMLFVAGARISFLMGAVICALPFIWYAISSASYRMRRIMSFLDPWADRQDGGYQVVESLISIGSGSVFGVGLGDGKQKLFFLPDAHNDFIFAIIGEELGLIGTMGVIVLFVVLIWRGLRAAFKAEDAFSAYLAVGLTSLLGIQAFVHMSVVTALLPTTGLTLPFISYGGSSLLICMVAVGLLLAISRGRGGFLSPAPGDPR